MENIMLEGEGNSSVVHNDYGYGKTYKPVVYTYSPTGLATTNSRGRNFRFHGAISPEGAKLILPIYNYLTKEKGLSENLALALIANSARESGINPHIGIVGTRGYSDPDKVMAGGLFQIDKRVAGGKLYKDFLNYAKQRGVDPTDYKMQIDYFLDPKGYGKHYLKYNAGTLAYLRNNPDITAYDMANAILRDVERPEFKNRDRKYSIHKEVIDNLSEYLNLAIPKEVQNPTVINEEFPEVIVDTPQATPFPSSPPTSFPNPYNTQMQKDSIKDQYMLPFLPPTSNVRINQYAYGGLVEYNKGGTHEENPYQGIHISNDDNGKPNLVEQGETKYNDFIFSKRIKPIDSNALTQFGIPKRYAGKSYADISKSLNKEYLERPNDVIYNKYIEQMMEKLKKSQEYSKEEMNKRKADKLAKYLKRNGYTEEDMMQLLYPQMAQQGIQDPNSMYEPLPQDMYAEGGYYQDDIPSQLYGSRDTEGYDWEEPQYVIENDYNNYEEIPSVNSYIPEENIVPLTPDDVEQMQQDQTQQSRALGDAIIADAFNRQLLQSSPQLGHWLTPSGGIYNSPYVPYSLYNAPSDISDSIAALSAAALSEKEPNEEAPAGEAPAENKSSEEAKEVATTNETKTEEVKKKPAKKPVAPKKAAPTAKKEEAKVEEKQNNETVAAESTESNNTESAQPEESNNTEESEPTIDASGFGKEEEIQQSMSNDAWQRWLVGGGITLAALIASLYARKGIKYVNKEVTNALKESGYEGKRDFLLKKTANLGGKVLKPVNELKQKINTGIERKQRLAELKNIRAKSSITKETLINAKSWPKNNGVPLRPDTRMGKAKTQRLLAELGITPTNSHLENKELIQNIYEQVMYGNSHAEGGPVRRFNPYAFMPDRSMAYGDPSYQDWLIAKSRDMARQDLTKPFNFGRLNEHWNNNYYTHLPYVDIGPFNTNHIETPTTNDNTNTGSSNDDDKGKDYSPYLRFLPIAASGAAVLGDLFSSGPNYQDSERVERMASEMPYMSRSNIGRYAEYTPYDRNYAGNRLIGLYGANQQVLRNNYSGSPATMVAGMLANTYNNQQQLAGLDRQAQEYNTAMRMQALQQNNQIDQYNDQANMQVQQANIGRHQAITQAYLQSAALRQREAERYSAARSNNLSNFVNSIGNFGREAYNRNVSNGMFRSYDIDPLGNKVYKKTTNRYGG